MSIFSDLTSYKKVLLIRLEITAIIYFLTVSSYNNYLPCLFKVLSLDLLLTAFC